MGIAQLWNEYELFFHYEFINDSEFSPFKNEKLQKDMDYFFIAQDFTIYQEKAHPKDKINETDYHRNFGTFICILYNLPIYKVKDFIEFHYDKYSGNKKSFLEFVYHELKGSKSSQGNKELPPRQQKIITMEWCQSKLEELTNTKKKLVFTNKEFIHLERINELEQLSNSLFDFAKLIRLLQEINDNFSLGNYLSVSMLCRAVIDHIPPLFNLKTFNEVSSNYGNASFKKNMKHLNDSMRSIADNYLHVTIRKSESLPNENQIDFSRELDFLIGEIIRLYKSQNTVPNSNTPHPTSTKTKND